MKNIKRNFGIWFWSWLDTKST